MTKIQAKTAPAIVLAIDIGGTHVKVMVSSGAEERRFESGPKMTAEAAIKAIKALVKDWQYDVVSIGYPGPAIHGKPLKEPSNLGTGWVGLDFARQFGRPVKLVNDALMQAIGSYQGGRMLFLGLGTGLGVAMIVDNVAQPMEIGHLPFKKGRSFEDYVGAAGLRRTGRKKWRKNVFMAIDELRHALEPDDIVIGGGNVERLDDLPAGCRRGDNRMAFEGGFRMWRDGTLIV